MESAFQDIPTPAGKDDKLWNVAKARAGFKTHLSVFIVIIAVLWTVWLVTGGLHSYPWPVWPTVGWGIGVLFNYLGVYKFDNAVDKEYQKLLQQETKP